MTAVPKSALLVGFAVTGQAAARVLTADGAAVVAVDDGEISAATARAADELGVRLVGRPARAVLGELARKAELVVLSPGVPPSHPIFAVADHDKIVAEIELASALSSAPVVAVTGTNGKTTVTALVAEMLVASGKRAEAVGNIGRPLVEAVVAAESDIFVVEVSSFQLAWTKHFRPSVACWLNLAEDHLDWHPSLEAYAAAKGRIWANQGRSDVAVANCEDAVVMSYAARAPGRLVTFGSRAGDFHEDDGVLLSPAGPLLLASELPRSLPHDRLNALAATAVAEAASADLTWCAAVLRRATTLRHRIELVEDVAGVAYYDDSKATTPSAVLAALAGFERVLLIAGGRNKGLRLGSIAETLEAESSEGGGPGLNRLAAVVAIGESADEVVGVFAGKIQGPVLRAASMAEAVGIASRLARPGDSVILSPGCASFDWYRNYGERGDDFARLVRRLAGEAGGSSGNGKGQEAAAWLGGAGRER